MTEQQEKILKHINTFKNKMFYLNKLELISSNVYFGLDSAQENKLFDDFKENLKNYYDAQIDNLLAQLAEKSAAQSDYIKRN